MCAGENCENRKGNLFARLSHKTERTITKNVKALLLLVLVARLCWLLLLAAMLARWQTFSLSTYLHTYSKFIFILQVDMCMCVYVWVKPMSFKVDTSVYLLCCLFAFILASANTAILQICFAYFTFTFALCGTCFVACMQSLIYACFCCYLVFITVVLVSVFFIKKLALTRQQAHETTSFFITASSE